MAAGAAFCGGFSQAGFRGGFLKAEMCGGLSKGDFCVGISRAPLCILFSIRQQDIARDVSGGDGSGQEAGRHRVKTAYEVGAGRGVAEKRRRKSP
jgi:hypothetical protein